MPVVCGGTGLYIDNLINGTTPIPEAEPEVRHKVAEAAAAEGIPALHARLSTVDAVTADRLSPNDSTRVKRALEVFIRQAYRCRSGIGGQWFRNCRKPNLSR